MLGTVRRHDAQVRTSRLAGSAVLKEMHAFYRKYSPPHTSTSMGKWHKCAIKKGRIRRCAPCVP